jgi:hypothetical protein
MFRRHAQRYLFVLRKRGNYVASLPTIARNDLAKHAVTMDHQVRRDLPSKKVCPPRQTLSGRTASNPTGRRQNSTGLAIYIV